MNWPHWNKKLPKRKISFKLRCFDQFKEIHRWHCCDVNATIGFIFLLDYNECNKDPREDDCDKRAGRAQCHDFVGKHNCTCNPGWVAKNGTTEGEDCESKNCRDLWLSQSCTLYTVVDLFSCLLSFVFSLACRSFCLKHVHVVFYYIFILYYCSRWFCKLFWLKVRKINTIATRCK